MTDSKDESLSAREISKICQVTQGTVYHWIKRGRLKCDRRSPFRILKSDFNDFLKTGGIHLS